MKNRLLLFLTTAVPVILFTLIFFAGCDGFFTLFHETSALGAVLMILIPVIISVVSVIAALVLFFRIYGKRGRTGELTIDRRSASFIAFGVAFFIFTIHVLSDRSCN